MKNFKLLLIIIACANIFAGCKKDKTISEIDRLPAATQTGAKTFGCLLNGKAFTPISNTIGTLPLRFYYYNTNGGQFGLEADNGDIKTDILFGIDTCIGVKRYTYQNIASLPVRFAVYNNVCDLSVANDPLVSAAGYIDITKFDLTTGIISGIFEFTLYKAGCETISITNGRFDAKL